MYFKKRIFPTTLLYDMSKLLSVRKLYIMNVALKVHKNLIYDPSILLKRRKDKIICIPSTNTNFASIQYQSRAAYLYNKINKEICIYDKLKFQAKKNLTEWMQGKSYDDIEKFIEYVT